MSLSYLILSSFAIGLKSSLNEDDSSRVYGRLKLIVSHSLLHSLLTLLQSRLEYVFTHFLLELAFKLVQLPAHLRFDLSNPIRYLK